MNPMCSACCEKSDKKFITMCGGQEIAFHLCNKCYNIIKKEIFSPPNIIDLFHPVKGVFYHICQIRDKEGNLKCYTNGAEEERGKNEKGSTEHSTLGKTTNFKVFNRENSAMEEKMNYCNPLEDKEHVEYFIRFLYNEVKSAGDGDGLWYSTIYDIKDLEPIILSVLNNYDYGNSVWRVCSRQSGITYFSNGEHSQEGFAITNSEEVFNNRPDWQQIAVQW